MVIIAIRVNGRDYYYSGYVSVCDSAINATTDYTDNRDFATQFSGVHIAQPVINALKQTCEAVWIEIV